jgi:hypothetical protein
MGKRIKGELLLLPNNYLNQHKFIVISSFSQQTFYISFIVTYKMQNHTYLDDSIGYILSEEDLLDLFLWAHNLLEIQDPTSLFTERLEQQSCSYTQLYLPDTSQRSCTIFNRSFEGGLASYNGVPPQLHVETGQSHGEDYMLGHFSVLPFDVNHGLLHMNRPEMTSLTSETSVPTGSNRNENHDSLRDSVMQERYINSSDIEEAEHKAMVYSSNNHVIEVESKDENSLSSVTDSTLGDTGSPPSSPYSSSDTESCPICRRTSSRPYNLRSHILTHSSGRIKKFQCRSCSQRFYRSSDMQRHYGSIHLGKRFVCQCGKQYTRKNNLKKHEEREH